MNAPCPTAIGLIIFGGGADHTQRMVTSLRNGGLAVHGQLVNSVNELDERLQANEGDILVACDFDPAVNIQRLQEILGETERDIPFLIMSDESGEPTELLQAMRLGARDLLDKENLEHFQLVVAREFSDLQRRRELGAMKARLEESEQRCIGLIESSREPIAFIQDGMHVHVNPAYLEVFGFADASDVEDLPLLDLIEKTQHKSLRRAFKTLESDTDKQTITLDTRINLQDGSSQKATLHAVKASMEGEPCLQIIIRNKAENAEEIEQKLRQLSRTDEATQLPNRHFFLSQMEPWVEAAAHDQDIRALLYLSVDNFTKLRSRLGIQGYEELIRNCAESLRQAIEPDDLLARFSDNAFTLLCRRHSANAIQGIADNLCDQVKRNTLSGPDTNPPTTLSIGIALMTERHAEAQDLINAAYNTSESAREQGGDQALLVQPKRETATKPNPQDNKVAQQIVKALAADRFRLAYQPIVSLQGDSRENYAVLVRMLDDAEQELLPELFIKQAEKTGKMLDIDRWIVRNAIKSLSQQRKEGRKVNFFISLSEASIKDKNMLLWICDCLREYDARGGWLTFQIKEKIARENMQNVARLIEGLKKIRCQIALDHFGLLSRPEALLQHLDIDFIKLAPSFMREINTKQDKQDQLNSLNQMVIAHNCKTVATAVEDANSLTVLWTVGVGYIQGYFLQEPSETIEYGNQQLV